MASGSEVIGIEFVAKVDGILSAFNKLAPGADKEARAMAAAIEREFKRAEKVAKNSMERSGESIAKELDKIAKANAKAASQATGFSAFSDDAKKAKFDVGALGSNTAKLAGAMDMLGPSAGGATRAVADLADVGEVGTVVVGALGGVSGALAVGLVALAGAVAPVAGQLYVMHREAAEADARTQFLAEHADDLASALEGLETALTDAAIATGRLSEEQGEYVKNQDAATRALAEFRKSQEPARQAAEEQADAAETMLTKLEVLPGFLATAIDYYGGYTSAQKEAIWTLTELDKKEDEHQIIVSETLAATDEATAATQRNEKARKATADAVKIAAKAEREYADASRAAQSAMDEFSARAASSAAAMDRLADASGSLAAKGAAAVVQARDAELAQLEKIYQAGIAVADSDAQRTALTEQYSAARLTVERQAQIDIQKAMEETTTRHAELKNKEIQQSIAAAEAEIQALGSVFDSAASFADLQYDKRVEVADNLQKYLEANEENLTAAQKAALEKRIADQKESARAAFEISQAVQIAGALANTALAIVNALATVPYPAAPFVAAAAGVAGAAQVATILATEPSFHTGGGVTGQGGMYSDERRVKALTGETMVDRVTTADHGGAEGVRAALSNAGGGTTLRIGRLEAREIVRTDLRAGGLIPQEVRKVVSRNGRRVGISGRGVIA